LGRELENLQHYDPKLLRGAFEHLDAIRRAERVQLPILPVLLGEIAVHCPVQNVLNCIFMDLLPSQGILDSLAKRGIPKSGPQLCFEAKHDEKSVRDLIHISYAKESSFYYPQLSGPKT